MKPSEVLLKAAELVEPEGCWTTGVFARDSGGRNVPVDAPDATSWCARGAIAKALGVHAHHYTSAQVGRRAAALLFHANDEGRLARFNDAPNRTQAEVVAALRAAAELARGEGA